jgi:hypothetical protein
MRLPGHTAGRRRDPESGRNRKILQDQLEMIGKKITALKSVNTS